MNDLLAQGQSEAYKGGVHLAMFGLGSAVLLYNVGALLTRPSRHLAINAAAYVALVGFEAVQVARHFRGTEGSQ